MEASESTELPTDTAGAPGARLERILQPVVIGAGPAGLAATYALERRGFRPLVLERTDTVCSSWRGHYDGLRLNSPRAISSLPGLPLHRRYGTWVSRDDFISYVESYARRLRSPIEHGIDVDRLDRAEGGWIAHTSRGPLWTERVIVATGLNAVPYLPEWPGRDEFEGELIHAAEYKEASPFEGRHVLVVGMGQTGSDIGSELLRAGVGKLQVSIRTPPIIFPWHRWPSITSHGVNLTRGRYPDKLNDFFSRQLHRLFWGDLSAYGFPRPTGGLATETKRERGTLSYDTGFGFAIDKGLIPAMKRREVEVVPALDHFDGPEVVLRDGRRLRPDVVIAATGRRANLEPLVGHLGVLRPDKRPVVHGGACAPQAPRLHFIGYRLPPPQLPEFRHDARAIARRASRDARTRAA